VPTPRNKSGTALPRCTPQISCLRRKWSARALLMMKLMLQLLQSSFCLMLWELISIMMLSREQLPKLPQMTMPRESMRPWVTVRIQVLQSLMNNWLISLVFPRLSGIPA
jgi:hypothetical protein